MECFKEESCTQEAWAWVMGLPFHLWRKYLFKRLGDACRGFVAIDETHQGVGFCNGP